MLYTLNAMTLVLPMCDKRAKSAFILETLCRPAFGHKKGNKNVKGESGGLPIKQNTTVSE